MVLGRKVPILANSNCKKQAAVVPWMCHAVKISKQHPPCVLTCFNMFREFEKEVAHEPKKDLQS